ncbi:MAG: TRAP transporter large permease subunit [Deltaproteobacteria bacterium]|nr:TRAP transporter large permease subunit [Deltaproteobacteria bacterium]
MAINSESVAGGLEKIIGPASRTANYVSMGFLLVMPLPVFFDVLARFIYRGSIPGGIEIESFMLLVIVFLGIAHIQFSEGHIRIEFIISRFPEWVQNTLSCFHYLICTMFFGIMSSQLIAQGIRKIQDQIVTYDLEIPVWIFWFIAALGVIILTVVVALDFLKVLGHALRDRRPFWLTLALAAACFVLIAPMAGLAPTGLSGATAGILGMGFLFLLLFLGMPIGYGMALTGLLGMIVAYKAVKPSLAMLGIGPFDTASNYMLTVVPLFILMGEFAYHSGISEDLFETANKWLGRMPGGLAMSSVAGCAGFSAVCGDSLATAVTMGTVALPGMRKHNYDMKLATGCLAAGGTMGILIPPSVGFIFYAIVTEESIGKLFVAGIVPGIILAILFCGVIYVRAKINPALAPRGDVTTLKEKIVSLKGVVGMLALFILILGGILGGIFSPVEGGAIGSVGAFVYALIRGRVNKAMVLSSLQDSLTITCKLLLILIGVGILGYFLAATRLPFALANLVTGLEINRHIIFGAVIVFFIVLGCLLNVIPMILLVLPTIFPAITALGFDPIWFGVITVLTMEMGQITPPIGVNVFAIGSVARDVPMEDIFKGIFPFFLCMIGCVILLVLFPQLALYLPNQLFK